MPQNDTNKSSEIDRKQVNILGINVDSTSMERVLISVVEKVPYRSKFYIVTPNPELVLMTQRDIELKKALNSAHFAIPDGIGLSQAAKFLTFGSKNIIVTFFQGLLVGLATIFNQKWLTSEIKPIKGRVLFMELMRLSNEKGWKVFFLGGEQGETELAAKKISSKYKKIKILAEPGPIFNNHGEPATETDIKLYSDVVKKINLFKPELLIVCLSDPKDEKFVYKNYKKLNIVGAAAFGGTFRYVAGMSKLPPKSMENLGLEWLWRLSTEPFRFKRIWDAVVVFPLKVYLYKVG